MNTISGMFKVDLNIDKKNEYHITGRYDDCCNTKTIDNNNIKYMILCDDKLKISFTTNLPKDTSIITINQFTNKNPKDYYRDTSGCFYAPDKLKTQIEKLNTYNYPLQHIIYGPAGVGKTYSIKNMAEEKLGICKNNFEKQTIHTVFHPEYSYYDFFGKIMPKTINDNDIVYEFYPGSFMQALLKSYENISACLENPEKVVLVIDELNRGNASSIFGSLFNLLDRNDSGVSEYLLNIFGMEKDWLSNKLIEDNMHEKLNNYYKNKTNKTDFNMKSNDSLKIFIPHNLSIISTMNTSDETIFSLDKAFERRWKKSFKTAKESLENFNKDIYIEEFNKETPQIKWIDFLQKLNQFIIDSIDIDDIDNATIGAYFIKPVNGVIKEEDIKYTLMYYLWYDLFKGYRRETMLDKLFTKPTKPKTFEEFCIDYSNFIYFINDYSSSCEHTSKQENQEELTTA